VRRIEVETLIDAFVCAHKRHFYRVGADEVELFKHYDAACCLLGFLDCEIALLEHKKI